jgi:ribosomal protein S6
MARASTDALNQYEAMFLLPGRPAGPGRRAQAGARHHRASPRQILVIKKWDERKLAYELAGRSADLFILAYFKAPGPAIAAIERDVNLSDQIVRVLVTTPIPEQGGDGGGGAAADPAARGAQSVGSPDRTRTTIARAA